MVRTRRALPLLLAALATLLSSALAVPERAAARDAAAPRAAAAAAPITPPLRTAGTRIVDARGRTVILQGVNWFGFETANHVVHGLWTLDYRATLAKIRRLGFNALRLPFSLQALRARTLSGVDFSDGKNAALRGATPLEALDEIIAEAGRQGLLVLLDNHSHADDSYQDGLWYGRGFSEDDWVRAWTMLARRYRTLAHVIGADLKNEPHGPATWGDGGPTDWRRAAERAGNAILRVNPNWLIVVEGVGGGAPVPGQQLDTHWWGGNLEGVRRHPVRLIRPHRLVYSPHEYGPGVFPQPWFGRPDTPALLERRWRTGFGFILERGIAPILVGEFGGRRVDRASEEGRWQRQFFDYLARTGASWTYWALNPNSGDTGGVLTDDWRTVDRAKMALLRRVIARQRIAFRAGGTARPQPRARTRARTRARPPARRRARRRPAPAPPPPTPGAPAPSAAPAPEQLRARLVVEARWEGGWCAHVEIDGPAGSLAGRRVAFTLPAAARITQAWNAQLSGETGRVTAALPDWARIDGGAPYAATGFCVAGGGEPGDVTVS